MSNVMLNIEALLREQNELLRKLIELNERSLLKPQIRPVYTIPDLLRVLRVSKPTLYKLLSTGQLPSIKLSGRRLVRDEALQKFLKERETNTPIVPKESGVAA